MWAEALKIPDLSKIPSWKAFFSCSKLRYRCKTIQWVDGAASLPWMGGSITAPLVEDAGRSGQRVCHFGSALWGSVCLHAVGAVVSGRRRAGSAALCDTAAAAAGSRSSRVRAWLEGPRLCCLGSSPQRAARSEQPRAWAPVPAGTASCLLGSSQQLRPERVILGYWGLMLALFRNSFLLLRKTRG